MKTTFFAALVSIALIGASNVAMAETDWFKKGAEIFENVTQPSSAGSSTNAAAGNGLSLSNQDLIAGLKEALQVGSDTVVKQLGVAGGFANDPKIRIPLPDNLKTVRTALNTLGQGAMMDDLENRLNSAAEAAVPQAKKLFVNAISAMSIEDAQQIYQGPDDAATRYFQKKMTPELSGQMLPIVEKTLADAGAVKAYDNVMGQYQSLPFVPDVKSNLNQYVVDKGVGGIFYYLAQEEAEIRRNPVKRTTDLLKQVFGQK